MSQIFQAKKASNDAVNRALALALRAPVAASVMVARAAAPSSPTRHGQRANPVPLKRNGKPNT